MESGYLSSVLKTVEKMENKGQMLISDGERMIKEGRMMVAAAKAMRDELVRVDPSLGSAKIKASKLAVPAKAKDTAPSEHAKNYGRWTKAALQALREAPGRSGTVEQLVEVAVEKKILPGKPRQFLKKKFTAALHTMLRLKDPPVRAKIGPGGRSVFELAPKLLNA